MSNQFGAAPGINPGMPAQSTSHQTGNSAGKKEALRINAGPFVLSYPSLFVARKKMGVPKPGEAPSLQYSCELMMYSNNPKAGETYQLLTAAANQVCMAKFGKTVDSPIFKNKPVRDLAEKQNATETGFFISARSSQPPSIVIGSPPVTVTNPDDVYAGCFVYVNITPSTYDFEGNRGVKWFLNSVWKVADGPRLAAVRDGAQDFADLVGKVEVNLAPTQGYGEAPPMPGQMPPWAQPQQEQLPPWSQKQPGVPY